MDKIKVTIIIESPCKDKSMVNDELIMRGLKEGFRDLDKADIKIKIEH